MWDRLGQRQHPTGSVVGCDLCLHGIAATAGRERAGMKLATEEHGMHIGGVVLVAHFGFCAVRMILCINIWYSVAADCTWNCAHLYDTNETRDI